jgi:hypothetical protein
MLLVSGLSLNGHAGVDLKTHRYSPVSLRHAGRDCHIAAGCAPAFPNLITERGAMPEPTTSGAAGAAAGWKLIGGAAGGAAIATAMAAAVVMCMTPPRTHREWAVGIISTVMSSLCGGAFVIIKLGLLTNLPNDALSLYVLVAQMIGVVFACGLPGWAIVRWSFNWMSKREGKDLGEVARDAAADAKAVIGGGGGA